MSQFNPRDFLDNLLPRQRDDPDWQLIAELLRVDADFRASYVGEDAGFISAGGVDMDRSAEILDALRALPDDAARAQIVAAFAPFKVRERPEWRLMAEMLRVDAEFRKAYFSGGASGAISLPVNLDISRIDEILAVLRSLPDDTPRERLLAALAPSMLTRG